MKKIFGLIVALVILAPITYAQWNITLVPFTNPVVIPDSGGTFELYIFVENGTTVTETADVWFDLFFPDTTTISPYQGPTSYEFEVGTTGWYKVMNIPGTYPPGDYDLVAHVGGFPNVSFSSFTLDFDLGLAVENVSNANPDEFNLLTAYPNPFNPVTTLRFQVQIANYLELNIFDVHGARVANLIDGWRPAGIFEVDFDAINLPSGIYFAHLKLQDSQQVSKLMLLK